MGSGMKKNSIFRMKGKVLLSLLFLCTSISYSGDIDTLMSNYNRKNDLSQKTIDANKGHLVF